MNQEKKTYTPRSHIGLQGERLFEAYIGGLTASLAVQQRVWSPTSSRKYILKPIKIHQEDDLGADYDLELFENGSNKSGTSPSGLHFCAQVKTRTGSAQPSVSSLIDARERDYLNKQNMFNRHPLLIWQRISKDGAVVLDRKLLDFRKYLQTKQENWIQINNQKQGELLISKQVVIPVLDVISHNLLVSAWNESITVVNHLGRLAVASHVQNMIVTTHREYGVKLTKDYKSVIIFPYNGREIHEVPNVLFGNQSWPIKHRIPTCNIITADRPDAVVFISPHSFSESDKLYLSKPELNHNVRVIATTVQKIESEINSICSEIIKILT